MKTKIQIIRETAQYYAEDTTRRAKNDYGGCQYFTDQGQMCAVGRCFRNPAEVQARVFAKSLDNGSIVGLMNKRVVTEDDFAPEYRGHETEFWADLQDFHDSNTFWTDQGLSEAGMKNFAFLKHWWRWKGR